MELIMVKLKNAMASMQMQILLRLAGNNFRRFSRIGFYFASIKISHYQL